jgi:tRNA threonylcarbamoyladenosine biosynthesis protein TsaB
MAEASRTPGDLTGVVVCVGPGGFTSLRIGVATAEGLALTGLPTWGFSAFELRARALRVAGFTEPLWILLDGQRNEVFAQPWADTPTCPACKHPLADLPALLQGQPWWAPETFAAKACAAAGSLPLTLPDEGRATLAGLAQLCRELPTRPPEAPLVPFYLRETDAEVNFPEASRHLSDALRQGHAR